MIISSVLSLQVTSYFIHVLNDNTFMLLCGRTLITKMSHKNKTSKSFRDGESKTRPEASGKQVGCKA